MVTTAVSKNSIQICAVISVFSIMRLSGDSLFPKSVSSR
jgi:hypothetical protein